MSPDRNREYRTSRAFRLLPYVLFGFGLLSTYLLWWSARQSIDTKEQLEFERRLDQAHILAQRRIEEQITLLRATAAAIAIDPELTRSEYLSFSRSLAIGDNYPGLLGVGYAYHVRKDRIPTFEREMRRQGFADYRVHPGFDGPQFPIRYLEPIETRNRRAIGYNMFSDPVRQRAMANAMDTATPTATSKVVLVQDKNVTNEPGFLVYVPIFDRGIVPPTVDGRRRDIRGFAYSPIRAFEFFGTIFSRRGAPEIGIEIHSGGIEGNRNLLFVNNPPSFSGRKIVHDRMESIDIAGMNWTLRYFAPSYAGVITGSDLLPWVPLAGVLISVLLFGIARTQVNESEESKRLALEANRRAERERFLAETGRILASTLDSRATLDRVAALAVPEFAEWSAVDVPGPEGRPERIAIHHVDPDKTAHAKEFTQRYPSDPDAKRGVAYVLRTGEPEYVHQVSQDLLREIAVDEEHWRVLKGLEFKSYICVPLNVRGETLGAITFVSTDDNRPYAEEDFRLAQEIAARVAVALDNARLFEAAQREIQERKRAEQQVRDLNANLERIVDERTKELRATNNELEAFCYSVSHDLRTPLRSVDGFSKALIEDYGELLPEEGIDYVQRVRKASHRMDELITALLTLSRITRAEIVREDVNMSEVAQTAANEALRDVPPDQVRIEIEPRMLAKADARMVRIIYDNLISNALKFSATRSPQVVKIGRENGTFFVCDNGVGFNSEYESKLFAPFERLHSPREYPGNGVGLATVQRVVHKHGGEIWGESEVGKGATFYFTLA